GDTLRGRKAEKSGALAPAGVNISSLYGGNIRADDTEQVCAMQRECAAAYRPRKNARQLQNPNPFQRPGARGEGLVRGIVKPGDLYKGLSCNHCRMRMCIPFLEAAHHSHGHVRLCCGRLKIGGAPPRKRAGYGVPRGLTVEEPEHALPMMAEICVKPDPA